MNKKKNKLVNKKVIIYLIVILNICLLFFICQTKLSYKEKKNNENNTKSEMDYLVEKKIYMVNDSYVEYPQIKGLDDEKKQEHINKLLEDRALYGGKTFMEEPFVDLYNTDNIYEFEYWEGLVSNDIASFLYNITAHTEITQESGWVSKNQTDRYLGITIDMVTGEEIKLTDFMVVDDGLINSSDGTGRKTDYDSASNPIFYNFKDAFYVASTEEEIDGYHIFEPQEVIDDLIDSESETIWYINTEKNIVFYGFGAVHIPYTEISKLIYPYYLNILKNES